MNHFLQDFSSLLQDWRNLRDNLRDKDLSTIAVEVDRFWQQAPLVNHYLHPDYMPLWPDPWQLIYDNNYCVYARALGIIYTLLLTDTKNIALVDAKDDNSEQVVLVLVDNAKYILNYWPNTVLNNHLSDFDIIKEYDLSPLYMKIG